MDAGTAATAGTVMLAALPIMLGIQFLLAFVGYDVMSVPTRPRHGQFRIALTTDAIAGVETGVGQHVDDRAPAMNANKGAQISPHS